MNKISICLRCNTSPYFYVCKYSVHLQTCSGYNCTGFDIDGKPELLLPYGRTSIKYKESEGSIHKVAAKIMGTESYNGWTYWHCKVGDSLILIDSLRQRFLNKAG